MIRGCGYKDNLYAILIAGMFWKKKKLWREKIKSKNLFTVYILLKIKQHVYVFMYECMHMPACICIYLYIYVRTTGCVA